MTRQSTKTSKPADETNLPEDDYTGMDGPPPVAPTGGKDAGDGPRIGPTQMKQLHALAHRHGISTDKAMYGYLTVLLGREVTSRRSLTPVEAATAIRDLENTPVGPSTDALRALRAPFPEEAIGKLPRSTCKDCSDNRGVCQRHPQKFRCEECRNYHSASSMHIDFVGHADITARLLEVDPEWTWRPFTADELATVPEPFRRGLWIMLTVCGVTRPGFGDAEGGKGAKEAIGDALRNSAMRFGVALDLWAKGDREWAHTEKTGTDQHPDEAPSRQPQSDTSSHGVPPAVHTLGPDDWAKNPGDKDLTAILIRDLEELAAKAGTDLAGITNKWRNDHSGVPVDRLPDLAPMTLAPLVDSIRDYMHRQEGKG